MIDLLTKFERVVVGTLILMLALVVLLSVLELGRVLILDIITPPILILEAKQLLNSFGLFLLVLIGIELLETVKKILHGRSCGLGCGHCRRPDRT